MNPVLQNKYHCIFTVSVPQDFARGLKTDPETEIPEARQYFTKLVEAHVEPYFREWFERLLDPEGLVEAFQAEDSHEHEYIHADGEQKTWMRCAVDVTARGEKNEPAELLICVKDIDSVKQERLRIEQKKAERELLVNQAFENSKIMKFTFFVQEGYGLASQGIEDLHGAPRRLDGMPDSFRDMFVKPEFHAIHDEMYARCMQGINRASCELVDINDHWTRVTLEIVEWDDQGVPSIVLGIVENTDELHKVKNEAAILEEVCQFAVRNRYEEADLIDIAAGTVRSVLENEQGRQSLFHHEQADDYGQWIRELEETYALTDEDRELLTTLELPNLVPLLKENSKHSIRCRLKTGGEDYTWTLVECIFYKGDENKIIMLTTNVQEEENVKKRLRDAAEEAQEANRAKSAFLANMSHEIRTPMNAIVGISEILLGKQLPEDVLIDINTIQNSGSSLLGIINDILDFSKIETGKFEINEVEYMLPSILMDVSNVISVRLSGRPVYFMMDIDPALPNHFIGDDIRVKQILMNLIGNSVKFTKEGFVELRAEGHFLEDQLHYELMFEVRDSGIGIKEEDFDKLFKTFSQVDTRKNRAITGSGLGLSISKNLANMMDGDLTVESEYGKGSTFTVRIIQKVETYERIGEVHRKDVRMLICEQNETIIHSIRRTLERLEIEYDICREPDKIRNYEGMTHVMVRRKVFGNMREKLEFMFEQKNIYLILENDEHAEGHYMKYKQLQLPLLCMQLINALNGEEIISSIKKKSFDRSQIVPLSFARVLVVDDNTTNLQVAQGLMAPYKMKIDVATSGFKAIELVKAIHYDAIFMDHMMPEMDGIETAHYIREIPGDYYKKVPIIALTANAMSDAKKMFMESGMDDFVAKPIEMTELNRVLKKFVQPNAPEGYLKKIGVQTQAQPAGKEKNAFGIGAVSTLPVGSDMDGQRPMTVSYAGDPGIMPQLLIQNNQLLSQNMLLLKHLLGEPMEEASPVSQQMMDDPFLRPYAAQGAVAPEPENAEEPEEQGSYEQLRDHIPGVDMQKSIEIYGGSVPIYHNILKTYYFDILEREPKLRKIYEDRDIRNFTIYVHALKSASRGAGANELADMAYELETAGRNNDWTRIRAQFEGFMDELHRMVENVGKYARRYLLEEDAEEREKADRFDEVTVSEMKAACDEMDYLRVEELIQRLREKEYPEPQENLLKCMQRACEAFSYEELEKLIREI